MNVRPDTPAGLAGIGLKAVHVQALLERDAATAAAGAGFFEVHAENYMVDGGPMLRHLERVRERWPLSIHGVGLSIGGEGPLDRAHLDRLDALLRRFEPRWFSEHLAWSSHGGRCFNDLLPVPYNRATLDRVCDHIDQVQERLRRRLLLENPSTYLGWAGSTLDEGSFLAAVVRRTGCGLLLDVNNAHVSAVNHGRDPWALIAALPVAAVGEIHLAGFAEDLDAAGARLLIDHHGTPVDDAVWALYARAIGRFGPVPTLIERDNHIPALDVLEAEARQASTIQREVTSRRAPPAAIPPGTVFATLGAATPGGASAPPSQGAFAAALLDPSLPTPAGLQAWNGSDPGARLAVHRNNVVHSLVTVLADSFPVVRQLVGADFFGAMAARHVREQPPNSPRMQVYGAQLADWMAGFAPAADLPCLPDLARLEFARLQAWHALDVPPVDAHRLDDARADAERLAATPLVLHPSLTVLRSAHPVVSLWDAHQHDDAVRDARLAAIDLGAGEAALVFRQAAEALVLPVPMADAGLVAALADGHALGAAQAAHPHADLAAVLGLLLGRGLVTGLGVPARAARTAGQACA